jgi:hypothetical protein
MLISRETFGVSLPETLEADGPLPEATAVWETLLEEAARAGAGMVRASWSGADDPATRRAVTGAAARRLAVVAVCALATLRSDGAAALAAVADGLECYLELTLKEETAPDLLNGALLSARDLPVVLGLGSVRGAAPLPAAGGPRAWDASRVAAIGVEAECVVPCSRDRPPRAPASAGHTANAAPGRDGTCCVPEVPPVPDQEPGARSQEPERSDLPPGPLPDDDPTRMEESLRAFAAGLRARGIQQPIWLTLRGEPSDTPAAPDRAADLAADPGVRRRTPPDVRIARLVKHGAHALALGVPRIFLQLPAADAGATLRALRTLATWLDGARRITWLARGQYRAEFADRPNRYLLWADPEIQRLPSSLMGPLTVRDLSGEERRADTSSLRLTASPMLVERR